MDPQHGWAGMFKRTPAGYEVLGLVDVSVDWSDWERIRVTATEDFLGGYIEGRGYIITARDSEYPAGRVGLFKRALQYSYFWGGLN